MIIYSILIFFCLLFYFLERKGKLKKTNIFFWALITGIFLVSAFRYDVGQDYQHWTDVYEWIKEGLPAGNYVEIGYRFLNAFIQILPFSHVYLLFIVTSAFIIFGFGYLIYKNVDKKYWFLAVFIFIGSGIFFASLNLVRQYVAVVITTLGIPFLLKKKYAIFILFTLLATLFHTSALIMIAFMIFYLLFKEQKHHKALIVIYALSILFMIVDLRQIIGWFQFMIPERWRWYLQSEFLTDRNYSAIVKQLVPNAILIFVLWKRKEMIEKNKINDIFILMLFVNVVITNCFYGVLVLLRLSYFFDVSLVFIVPVIFELLEQYDKKIEKLGKLGSLEKLGKLSIIGYYILLTVVTIFIMNGHGVMPYQTIFSTML